MLGAGAEFRTDLTVAELRRIACRWRLGVRVDLVQVAVDALVAGLDSRSLRLLAGERSGAPYLAPLFEASLEELGIGPIDAEMACFLLAREIAGQIVAGELSEVEGARRIYREVYRRRPGLHQPAYLWEFVSVASSLEDLEWRAAETGQPAPEATESDRQRIGTAAEALVRMPGPPPRTGGRRRGD